MQPAKAGIRPTIRPRPGVPQIFVAVRLSTLSMEVARAVFAQTTSLLDTSTRRHTIGLIPSSQTLICTISPRSASGAAPRCRACSMTPPVRT